MSYIFFSEKSGSISLFMMVFALFQIVFTATEIAETLLVWLPVQVIQEYTLRTANVDIISNTPLFKSRLVSIFQLKGSKFNNLNFLHICFKPQPKGLRPS